MYCWRTALLRRELDDTDAMSTFNQRGPQENAALITSCGTAALAYTLYNSLGSQGQLPILSSFVILSFPQSNKFLYFPVLPFPSSPNLHETIKSGDTMFSELSKTSTYLLYIHSTCSSFFFFYPEVARCTFDLDQKLAGLETLE